jgi:hypothetical protein
MYPVKGPPHPNLAKLFVGWAVTEGMAIMEKDESMDRLSDPNAGSTRNIRQKYPNLELIAPRTAQELDDQNVIKEELTKLLTQAAR